MRTRMLSVAALLGAGTLTAVALGAPAQATAYADAGPDQSVGRNVLFQLDGQASADTGRRYFHWQQVSGPAQPVEVSPADLDVLFPYLRYDTPGQYVWRLTVDDTEGDVTTDEVTITVTPEGRMIHPHHHKHGFQFNEYVRHHRDTLETCVAHKHIHMEVVFGLLVERTYFDAPHGCMS